MTTTDPTNDQDHGGREKESTTKPDNAEPYRASHGSVADVPFEPDIRSATIRGRTLAWTEELPTKAGLYLWTDPSGRLSCVTTVVER